MLLLLLLKMMLLLRPDRDALFAPLDVIPVEARVEDDRRSSEEAACVRGQGRQGGGRGGRSRRRGAIRPWLSQQRLAGSVGVRVLRERDLQGWGAEGVQAACNLWEDG
jgi:hypothetical protein